jgi:DNA uptake protein ComE-like DNA-binding protein
MFRMKSASAVTLALALFAVPLAHAQGSSTPATEPAKAPATTEHHSTKSSSTKSAPKVDLNSASKEDLMKVHGITDAMADKIIAARPLKSKSELESKGIMTKAEYNKVSAHVVATQPKAEPKAAEPAKK